MYHYFYKITNNINNHFYYGVHSTNNLDDGYMGSGHRLCIAYKKYGIKNFTKEILKFFNTEEEAYKYEAQIVNENLTSSNECYNISLGGKTPLPSNKICVKYKNTETYFMINKDEYDKNIHDTTWTNRSHTQEQRIKIRKTMTPKNSNNPKVWISKNGKIKYLKRELLEEYLKNGWELGRINYKPRKNKQGKLLD